MTLNEIEITLDTLKARHPNLNEVSLTTMLSAGGWDDKTIKEAVFLFKNSGSIQKKREEIHNSLVNPGEIVQENKNPPVVEGKESSSKQNAPIPVENKNEVANTNKIEEPESLITPTIKAFKPYDKEVDIPHNLPLRPFETAPHVWPFSRYKDVFYGEVMPKLNEDEKKLAEKNRVEHLHFEHTPISTNDEILAMVSFLTLLVILFLLGYMYSNGRL